MSTSNYNLQGTSRRALLFLVEESITNLVRESVIVQRHCKRARIHVDSQDPDSEVVKRRLHADDINMALQWRGSEKLYATGITGTSLLGTESSKKIDLEEYLKSEMDLNPPQEVGLTVHWLAVDGVQPEIPQNPMRTKMKAPVHRIDDDADRSDEDDDDDDASNGGPSKSGIHVDQLLPRLLSEELQLYFSRVTTAVEQGGSTPIARQRQDAAVSSVANDAGLQELVPFFVDYVCKSLYKHLGNSEHCRTLVRLTHSLLVNSHLHLELHLHQLLPVLFTCIVARSLSSKSHENHWSLRDDAAMTLAKACNLFGNEYVTLKAQVLKTLCSAAAPADTRGKQQSRTTQYGGIVGISLFGPKAIDAFILPLVLNYWSQWEDRLAISSDLAERLELQMCQHAVLHSLGVYLRNGGGATGTIQNGWEDLEESFADRLVVMCEEPEDYALCFI